VPSRVAPSREDLLDESGGQLIEAPDDSRGEREIVVTREIVGD